MGRRVSQKKRAGNLNFFEQYGASHRPARTLQLHRVSPLGCGTGSLEENNGQQWLQDVDYLYTGPGQFWPGRICAAPRRCRAFGSRPRLPAVQTMHGRPFRRLPAPGCLQLQPAKNYSIS
jgi:hypothetical protein